MPTFISTLYAAYHHNGVVRLRLGIHSTSPANQLLLDAKHKRILRPSCDGNAGLVLAWIKNDAPGASYPQTAMIDSDHGASGDFATVALILNRLAKVGHVGPVAMLDAISSWAPLNYFDSQLNAYIPVAAGIPRAGHPCWKLGNTGLRAVAPNLSGVVKLAADYEEAQRGFLPNEYTAWLKEGAPARLAEDDGTSPLDLCIPERWVAA